MISQAYHYPRGSKKAVEEIGGRIRRFSLPGALFDHIPFADRGFDAVSLLMVSKSALTIHTHKDTPDLLDKAGFDHVGRLVISLIDNLARA